MNALLFDFWHFFFLSIFDDVMLRNDEIFSTSSFYKVGSMSIRVGDSAATYRILSTSRWTGLTVNRLDGEPAWRRTGLMLNRFDAEPVWCWTGHLLTTSVIPTAPNSVSTYLFLQCIRNFLNLIRTFPFLVNRAQQWPTLLTQWWTWIPVTRAPA